MAKKRKMDSTAWSIADLEAEKRKHYQSGDKKKLEEVKSKLDFIYFGIKKK